MSYSFEDNFLRKDRDTEPMIKIPSWNLHREKTSNAKFQGNVGQQCSTPHLKPQLDTFHLPPSPSPFQQKSSLEISNNEKENPQVHTSPLISLVEDYTKIASTSRRVAFLEALESQGQGITFLLLLALDDDEWEVRATAARKLGNFHEETAVANLCRAYTRDEDESVREAIVRALGKQKQLKLSEWFTLVLYEDTSWLVREAAAWALGKLGSEAPIRPLINALQNDPDDSVRAAAARSLGQVGKREVEIALFDALNNDEDLEVQDTAALALQELDPDTQGLIWRDKRKIVNETSQKSVSSLQDIERRMEEACQTLQDFIEDKRGYVYPSKVLEGQHGPVLFLACLYQHTERSIQDTENYLAALDTPIEPIECALKEDTVIQQATRQVVALGGRRPWKDLLIVSFDFSSPPANKQRNYSPFKVVVAGMGCDQVRKTDHSLLPQIVQTWSDSPQLQDSFFSDQSSRLTDVKVWYQLYSPSLDYSHQHSA